MKAAVAPAQYDEKTLYAVRAFMDGKATEGQQIIVRDWLLMKACALSDISFSLGGEDGRRITDFHQGRQFPARQLVALTKPEALAALKPRKSKAAVEKEASE